MMSKSRRKRRITLQAEPNFLYESMITIIADRDFSLSVFLILFMLNLTGVFLRGENKKINRFI